MDWARNQVRPETGSPHRQVPYICRICKKENWIKSATLLRRLDSFTGACAHCTGQIKSERVTAKYRAKGTETLPNGIKVYWHTATPPKRGTSNYSVKVECNCGYVRNVRVPALLHGKTSGRCRSCSAKFQTNSVDNPRRKGKSLTADGYRCVRISKSHPYFVMAVQSTNRNSQWAAILEHRLVAAISAGRLLEKWEHVHHIDGNKLNNTPENLQIISPENHAAVTAMQREINRLRKQVTRLQGVITDLQAQSETKND